jgi:hypothetical protein
MMLPPWCLGHTPQARTPPQRLRNTKKRCHHWQRFHIAALLISRKSPWPQHAIQQPASCKKAP